MLPTVFLGCNIGPKTTFCSGTGNKLFLKRKIHDRFGGQGMAQWSEVAAETLAVDGFVSGFPMCFKGLGQVQKVNSLLGSPLGNPAHGQIQIQLLKTLPRFEL